MVLFLVEWETDGDRGALAALPKEVQVPEEVVRQGHEATCNHISDQFGWLISSLRFLDPGNHN